MGKKFNEYKQLDLVAVNREVLAQWDAERTFEQSLERRRECPPFVFFEGPPSANGMPGIHHVISRAIKDVFCRYKTQKGFLVERKAGWDTHGLPVELAVEKMLGITKDDIGSKISVEDYNAACRREVLKYTKEWETLTRMMGYWVDMQKPYITYDNRYIETLWYLLKRIYGQGLLYKGYSIQPYSPAAGTGLSSHELNQPGCYRNVKDTACVAQFKVIRNEQSAFLFGDAATDALFFLAWTTTPWTLPSNTALAVGKHIRYVSVETFNPYTAERITVLLARERAAVLFPEKNAGAPMEYRAGDKALPYRIGREYPGSALEGLRYEQLLPYAQPETGDAFRVVCGDFVTTDDGTGIVHIAPSFGVDDFRVARENGIGALTLVSRQGRFIDGTGDLSGRFVKNDYDPAAKPDDETVDVYIALKLKKAGRAFKIERYEHSYPHCWRTDKPVLYYPLDAWFIRTTAVKDRLIALNNTIRWKPESTGTGRFGKWLENLQDWNLSRSRFWGTPLPVWRTADGSEERCIGSVGELFDEIEKAVAVGVMPQNPWKEKGFTPGLLTKENYDRIDLHRPYVDDIVLVSPSGKAMRREADLIDVWFDSGAMPFAQNHYPFATDTFRPADFIAEGVDQTRGWFFTLHAIAGIITGTTAYRSVVANGLVLDREGNKMSKRLGNAVDPFKILDTYGADALRWYLLTNAQPWDNLKFDPAGVDEVRRKFFGTLYNTYSFFALYANVDGFTGSAPEIPVRQRPEIDRWIISLLNTLVKETGDVLENYDVTLAGRMIQDFVCDHLSNWYVRLNRKRFWGGQATDDKLAAYQTLYTCLETVARLAAPVAPFFMERLYTDLNRVTERGAEPSVHCTEWPAFDPALIDPALERQMALAQRASSMTLALRRKVNIKVRQPLTKMMIPVLDTAMQKDLEAVRLLVLNEVNVKEMHFLTDATGVIVKKIKPKFNALGKKYGSRMKEIAAAINAFDQQQIDAMEKAGQYTLTLASGSISLLKDDVEITSEDLPGWLVATEGALTIALDITVTDALRREGLARELINRIQNLRKESGFDITDKIRIRLDRQPEMAATIAAFGDLIQSQTLAVAIDLCDELPEAATVIEIDEIKIAIRIDRLPASIPF
ncbi:MAG: isoleucine--tRNA ligase [Prevotellaceae bacterium]|jgi:isoleucyl-tRNA synthetase|nr:isoleucine--tRNA ligase [Prevotellaceae bacterium]